MFSVNHLIFFLLSANSTTFMRWQAVIPDSFNQPTIFTGLCPLNKKRLPLAHTIRWTQNLTDSTLHQIKYTHTWLCMTPKITLCVYILLLINTGVYARMHTWPVSVLECYPASMNLQLLTRCANFDPNEYRYKVPTVGIAMPLVLMSGKIEIMIRPIRLCMPPRSSPEMHNWCLLSVYSNTIVVPV